MTEGGTVRLRPARLEDAAGLNRRCYPRYLPEEMIKRLSASLERAEAGHGVRLVAESDGEIVGCGELLRWHHGAEIADLIVIPTRRNQGIGEALIKGLLDHARDLGMVAVEIGVEAENWGARALYERLGFSPRRRVQHTLDGRPTTTIFLEMNSALHTDGDEAQRCLRSERSSPQLPR